MSDFAEINNDCPALEILAAYLEGKLTVHEKASVEEHLAVCRKCRKLVSLTIKSETSLLPPTNSDKQ